MAKPTVLPRWANSGGSVATPSSGKLDIGWLPKEKPPAQYFNWLGLHTYNWIAWLDALFPSDNLALDANKNATVSGTGSFVISGTGKYKRPAFVTPVHAAAAQKGTGGGAAGNLTSISGWTFGSAGETIVFNVPCEEGERILAVSTIMVDGGADTCTVTLHRNVWAVGAGVTQTSLANANTAGSTGVVELVTFSGLTEDVPATGLTNYTVTVACNSLVSGLSCKGILVTKSVP